MKLYYNIGSINYIIYLNEIFIYLESDNQMKYLFIIKNSNLITKKYLLDINYFGFKFFIEECLTIGYNKISKMEFDASIVQLLENYEGLKDLNLKIFLNKKIGNLILCNPEYKNFYYLKKFQKYFYDYTDYGTTLYNVQNTQVKYLLILINSLENINISKKINKKLNDHQDFDMLDFIFDYYLN